MMTQTEVGLFWDQRRSPVVTAVALYVKKLLELHYIPSKVPRSGMQVQYCVYCMQCISFSGGGN